MGQPHVLAHAVGQNIYVSYIDTARVLSEGICRRCWVASLRPWTPSPGQLQTFPAAGLKSWCPTRWSKISGAAALGTSRAGRTCRTCRTCRHSGPHGHSRADQPGQAGAGTTGAGRGSHSFQGSLCLSTVFFSGALDVWWLEIELGWWKSWCGWMQNFFLWNFEKMAANYGFGSLLFWPMIPIQIVDGLYQKFGYVWTIWFVQASVHVWVTSSRMF
jgi:hypothetical protein